MTNESAAARQRRMARRRILREIGVAPKDATRGSECVSRFVSMIEGQGGDPEELDPGGELRKIREGGRPKVNIPDNEARSARYRELRKMGLGSLAATEGARTEGTFAMAVRSSLARNPGHRSSVLVDLRCSGHKSREQELEDLGPDYDPDVKERR